MQSYEVTLRHVFTEEQLAEDHKHAVKIVQSMYPVDDGFTVLEVRALDESESTVVGGSCAACGEPHLQFDDVLHLDDKQFCPGCAPEQR